MGWSESSPERTWSRRTSGFRAGGGTGTHPTPSHTPLLCTILIPDARYIITQLTAYSSRGAAREEMLGEDSAFCTDWGLTQCILEERRGGLNTPTQGRLGNCRFSPTLQKEQLLLREKLGKRLRGNLFPGMRPSQPPGPPGALLNSSASLKHGIKTSPAPPPEPSILPSPR